jgi:hypothetical protein
MGCEERSLNPLERDDIALIRLRLILRSML